MCPAGVPAGVPADSTGESVAVFPVRDWDEEAVTATTGLYTAQLELSSKP